MRDLYKLSIETHYQLVYKEKSDSDDCIILGKRPHNLKFERVFLVYKHSLTLHGYDFDSYQLGTTILEAF